MYWNSIKNLKVVIVFTRMLWNKNIYRSLIYLHLVRISLDVRKYWKNCLKFLENVGCAESAEIFTVISFIFIDIESDGWLCELETCLTNLITRIISGFKTGWGSKKLSCSRYGMSTVHIQYSCTDPILMLAFGGWVPGSRPGRDQFGRCVSLLPLPLTTLAISARSAIPVCPPPVCPFTGWRTAHKNFIFSLSSAPFPEPSPRLVPFS